MTAETKFLVLHICLVVATVVSAVWLGYMLAHIRLEYEAWNETRWRLFLLSGVVTLLIGILTVLAG